MYSFVNPLTDVMILYFNWEKRLKRNGYVIQDGRDVDESIKYKRLNVYKAIRLPFHYERFCLCFSFHVIMYTKIDQQNMTIYANDIPTHTYKTSSFIYSNTSIILL